MPPASASPRRTTLDWIAQETEHLRRSSYGRFDLEVIDSTSGWVRMPAPADVLRARSTAPPTTSTVGYIQDAIDASDAQIDFSQVQLTIVVIPQTRRR
jgi:hypothetical protein